ncbi:heterokaryon incompatibility protein (HET) domain-containing protein [Sarocladium implicatum]|nr:heterokaryon incompatibility protein (HET) domain-containing protein [Sarocladium implicatum]
MKAPALHFGNNDAESESSEDDGAGPDITVEASLYRYEPLQQGEVRLLVLLEADDLADDLECGLITTDLASFASVEERETSYTAISYVWGRGRKTRIVHIGDKRLYIGRNLDSALRHLRRRDQPTFIWVDAVCINQTDLQERNHQVQQMRDIFEHAEETIAYLGDYEGGHVAASAWNFLERQSSWALNENMEKDYNIPRQREEQIHFRGDLDDVYHKVLTKQWFHRVWVFQEAVVSKRLSIQSGHRRVPWDDFIRSTVLQTRNHDRYGQSLRQMNRFEFARQLWQARVSFHVARGQQKYLPAWYSQYASATHESYSTDMLDMLVLARARLASDPKDKVFALLGVSTGFDWQANGTVDYGKTTAQVYQDFAVEYMASRKDYRALSYLNRLSRPEFLHRQMKRWSTLRKRAAADLETIHGTTHEDDGDDEYATYSENLIQQVQVDSSIVEQKQSAHFISPEFLSSISQTCSRRLRESQEELEEYVSTGKIAVPTWVPYWNCRDIFTHEPRAIIEVIDSAAQSAGLNDCRPGSSSSEIEVDCFRTWTTGYAPGAQAIPRRTLAVQGRVIGRLVKNMSSTSLLGRDESTFMKLRNKQKVCEGQQPYSPEAQKLAIWAHALEQTKLEEQLNGEDVGQLNAELARKFTCDVDGTLLEWAKLNVSFPLCWQMIPPEPETIESFLVERAEMGTDWSTDSVGSLRVVPAPKSVLDQRLLGIYRATKLDPTNPHPKTVLLHEARRRRMGEDLGDERLVLLPLEAKFRDLVVIFPGAKVPFLVRSKYVSRMEDFGTRKVHRGNLPRIETAKLYVECALIGECWVNGFKDIVKEEKVYDVVVSVQ